MPSWGSVYFRSIFSGRFPTANNPRVGLLSVGEEETKGNELTREAFQLIKPLPLNFLGNVEGRDLYNGRADVIVCDGFVGNVALKVSEGMVEAVRAILKEALHSTLTRQMGYLLARAAFMEFKKRLDYSEYGGAPLLGLKGVAIVSHGSSNGTAIKNAIRVAAEFARSGLNQTIEEKIQAARDQCRRRVEPPNHFCTEPSWHNVFPDSHSSSPARARKPLAWARNLLISTPSPAAFLKKPTRRSDTRSASCASKGRRKNSGLPRSPSRRFSPFPWPPRACSHEAGIVPSFVAGHSLGEYSAHVVAGTFSFADAVRTVRHRGQYMQEAVPVGVGAMAAVLNLSIELVREACKEAAAASSGQVCEPANINSPGQVVISGAKAAVEHAAELCKHKGAKRAILLPVSAPFHCSMMKPAQDRLAAELHALAFHNPRIPVMCNVDAVQVRDADKARDSLVRQVTGAVQWEGSLRALIAQGATQFVEAGPGSVLTGLLRQIDRSQSCHNVENEASLQKATASVAR